MDELIEDRIMCGNIVSQLDIYVTHSMTMRTPPPNTHQPNWEQICTQPEKHHIGYLRTEENYLLVVDLSGVVPIGPRVLIEGLIGST